MPRANAGAWVLSAALAASLCARDRAAGDADKEPAKAPRARRKKAPEPASRGLDALEVARGELPAEVETLLRSIASDGGAVLGRYRDPLGGHWLVLASLPLERVRPTPYQRDLSPAHVERLGKAIEDVDRYLDPVIAVRAPSGEYWTPNGYHRTEAMRRLGAKAVVALVVPEAETAYRILALNTEKAHNLKEKALEVVRMAKDLAALDARAEVECSALFEDPSLLTLGLCYEERPRFAGRVGIPVPIGRTVGGTTTINSGTCFRVPEHVLAAWDAAGDISITSDDLRPDYERVEEFLPARLSDALERRRERARLLLGLDDAVAIAVEALKARGFESPYLKNFVVARINPLRFHRGPVAPFEATVEKMTAAARGFDAAKVKAGQLAQAGGPPASAE